MTPLAEHEELQKLYRAKRLRWARKIGRPVFGHEREEPEPAILDGADPEEG